jgi:hypothetical protein
MGPATRNRPPGTLFALLAGLQAGMVGAFVFLAWMGVTARLERRSFWTPENLMASVFYGGEAIRAGLASTTFSGLALYLLLYSMLGAVFAATFRNRLSRLRLTLAGILFGLGWYFLSFRLIWSAIAPLVTLLHIESTTMWGHAIYGALLARYPVYAAVEPEPTREVPGADEPPPETPQQAGDADSGSREASQPAAEPRLE